MVKGIYVDLRESRDTSRQNAQWITQHDPIIESNSNKLASHERNLVVLNYVTGLSKDQVKLEKVLTPTEK